MTFFLDTNDVLLAAEILDGLAPRGLRSRDVLHTAVMRRVGLTHILSADPRIDMLDELVRVDPGAYSALPAR